MAVCGLWSTPAATTNFTTACGRICGDFSAISRVHTISAVLATGAFQFHDYLDRSVSGNDDDEIVRFRCVDWLVIGVGRYEYEVAGVDRLFLLQLLTGEERSAAADHVYRRFAVDVVVRG